MGVLAPPPLYLLSLGVCRWMYFSNLSYLPSALTTWSLAVVPVGSSPCILCRRQRILSCGNEVLPAVCVIQLEVTRLAFDCRRDTGGVGWDVDFRETQQYVLVANATAGRRMTCVDLYLLRSTSVKPDANSTNCTHKQKPTVCTDIEWSRYNGLPCRPERRYLQFCCKCIRGSDLHCRL